MANNVLVSELPKSILEMSMNGDEPPSEYLVKGNSFGSKEDSSTLIPI
ncbi:flavonol synthase/flavanone 3-hydroxylase, partial [Trifolium medium]|nr:flavonol synthase/flavanone 3-hydroxylase [Trifolium medium]